MFPISRQVMYFMLLLGGSWFSPLVGSPCLKPYLVLKTQLDRTSCGIGFSFKSILPFFLL